MVCVVCAVATGRVTTPDGVAALGAVVLLGFRLVLVPVLVPVLVLTGVDTTPVFVDLVCAFAVGVGKPRGSRSTIGAGFIGVLEHANKPAHNRDKPIVLTDLAMKSIGS